MKVLQVPFTYPPDASGGTEVYVASLVEELARRDIACAVAAPTTGERRQYRLGAADVHRYPTPPSLSLDEIYGEGTSSGAAAFAEILDAVRPSLVHLHAFTSGVSLLSLRVARERGIPVVFTYHTPTVSCVRGTLMLHGTQVCDGVILVDRCASCFAESVGVRAPLASALGHVPTPVGRAMSRLGLEGEAWTALRLTSLVELRGRSFHALMQEAAVIVAVSQWVSDVLVRNGIPAEKIVVSPQGVSAYQKSSGDARQATAARQAGPMRAVVLARLSPVKGIDLLLRALASRPHLAMTLDVYGVVENPGDQYAASLQRMAQRDPRVRLLPPIPADGVVDTLRGYDVTLVPSQWLETGPLVVLESFAAGIPVIGSRRGGIEERVRDGVDGLLVEPASVEAWAKTLERATNDPALLPSLRASVAPPRTAAAVAEDMIEIYRRVLGNASAPVAARGVAGAA